MTARFVFWSILCAAVVYGAVGERLVEYLRAG